MNNSCVINYKCANNNDKTFCEDCQEIYCNNHINECYKCEIQLCHRCVRKCNNCQEFYCKDCLILCLSKYCFGMYCEKCNKCDNECLHNDSESED